MDELIFEFVYDMAFRDATMRKAFVRNETESVEEFHIRKDRVKNDAREILRRYIDGIIKEGKSAPLKTIIDIRNKCHQDGFTFGNAQKLVNMTAKYLFIVTYDSSEMIDLFRECDCPMDRNMLENASFHDVSFNYKNESWSGIDLDENGGIPDLYINFQTAIKRLCDGDCIPLEYDYKEFGN